MHPEQQLHSIDRLQDAFNVFNRLSRNLSDSYHDLEAQVFHLSRELSAARTERLKTLTEKEKLANRLQTLLEALPGGVIVVNESGKIVDHNKAAGILLDKELIGLDWNLVMDEVFEAECENPQERTLKNGKDIGLSTSALGDEPGQIILLTDVTEIRFLQATLEQQKRLSTMGKTLASIAHQIRTPLTTAMLYASHLKKNEIGEEQRKKFSCKLFERLQHLERQVNDMLVFAKDGEFITEQVSLDSLINTLTEVVEGLLAGSSVKFKIENRTAIDLIVANEKALAGALTNLLSNAFEAVNGRGVVHLEIIEDDRHGICFSVIDDGPGIPQDCVDKVFEPFYTTRANGTGLGLSVVDRVARAHEGRAWYESPLAGGSRFQLALPYRGKADMLPSGFSHGATRQGVK